MSFQANTVVVPVDFSGESPNAIRTGLSIAGGASNLHLVHVLVPIDAISPGVLLGDVTEESRAAHVKEHLQKIAEENGAGDAHQSVPIGNPGLEVAEYAKDIKADLIIVPSHGYHGVKRMVLGSVAEKIIRHAECSVLVLRRSDAE